MTNRRKELNRVRNYPISGTIRPGLILVLALATVGAIVLLLKLTRSPAPEVDTEAAVEQVAPSNVPQKPTRTIAPSPRLGRDLASSVTPNVPPPRVAEPPAAETDALPRTPETIQAANAIARLAQLGSTNAVSAEQIAEINTQLSQIIGLGAPAAAAIHDFLQKDIDTAYGQQISRLGSGTGAPSSLRLGLIEALGKIGGPEATSVAVEALQKTLAPAEVGLLAKTLEQQAPGEYRNAMLEASRNALAAAAKNPSNEQQVAGLFQILQTYGDSSVIPDLQNFSDQWRYYGLMAVAGLTEGQGVPALVEMATRPGAQASGYQQLATRMLAELAPSNPTAQAALLEQAKAGQVSNWDEVAMALTGARLQFGQDLFADEKKPDAGKVTQTHHVVYGNQSFHTVAAEIPAAQIEQNRSLIDQLMGLTTDETARGALQRAKEKLSQATSN